MTEDVSSNIRLGITVIVVATLVATVINIVFIAQGYINSSINKFTSGADALNMQEFEKYNQNDQLHGSDVKAAISAYADTDYAICVATVKSGTKYYNYDALLDGASGGASTNYSLTMSLASGEVEYKAELAIDSSTNMPMHNKNRQGINVPGTEQYILDSGRFKANWITSEAGDLIGIAFTQIQ